ncbi:kelch repeat-containing protein [Geothrix sp. PMB-07]|uniref:kelch repeat-containing protein n=1 Tax=Geothrix sp. PMB-07 TaxID=3068640 RepID=UPI0027404B0E|nr:kelch repeat-containing protein [Geothrix sp. PMB-07]WLT32291.1 kelch repeat-containing protein [Geothrix sp. PMB-07]
MRVIGSWITWLFLGLALLHVGCKDPAQAPTGLSYSAYPAVYLVNVAITENKPTTGGGAPTGYSVSPALPAGLNLDASTGVISGTPTTAAAQATYTVTATNGGGSATVALSITVGSGTLSITTQPASQTVLEGQTATFSVVAAGTGTLTYQWERDGVAITGATSASYTTPATVLADSGAAFRVSVTDATNTVVKSDPATLTVTGAAGSGTTVSTGSMATPRAYHTATLLKNGQVLVVGGSDGSLALASAELYDPATGAFTATGSLVTARQQHSATLLADGKVLIAGGVNLGATLASAEVYDPAAGTFTATGNLAAARSDHSATLLASGKVLMVSGRDLGTYVATAEVYDPAAGTFSATTSAPLATRATHTATLLGNGKVLVAGGFRASALSTSELYDPATGAFTAAASMSAARSYHSATLLPNGQVLMAGGSASVQAELYNPATGTFTASGSLAAARSFWHTATLLATGKVLVFGGRGTGTPAPILASGELFDPATGLFSATGSLGTARELHTSIALPNGKVLVVGGVGFGYLASAELYY